MFDFIQKLIYLFITAQEKALGKKGKNASAFGYSNKTSKKIFRTGATLELKSQTEKNKVKLENNVFCIIKKYGNDPEKLIGFIRRSGTNVYQIPFANKILRLIGLEEGFIAETQGMKALWLNILTAVLGGEKLLLSLTYKPVIVLDKKNMDSCFIIKEFHKWYGMKLELPGYDVESQNNFQKFVNSINDEKIKELSIAEILGLKEAIARDIESINFVVALAKATTGSQNAMKKITAGGASV